MAKKERPYISPEDNKKANLLSVISLVCMFAPVLLNVLADIELIADFLKMLEKNIVWFSGFCSLLNVVLGLGTIAAIVLIILVRVKYPGNLFGKVVMWIYIVLAIVMLVFFVVLIVALGMFCDYIMTDCPSFCEGCRTMGVIKWF